MDGGALVIACGALARELVELQRRNSLPALRVRCLPAELHHRPDEIPRAVDAAIRRYRNGDEPVFVAYADCGTGGRLDKVLESHGAERIDGAHCYEFFAGSDLFGELSAEEPGTFYLTDFLVRHFDRFVVRSLKLDVHPQLKDMFFANYKRLVYLAQTRSEDLASQARRHAEYLGLEYVEYFTGMDGLGDSIDERVIQWRN